MSLWAISSSIERESEQIKGEISSFYNYQYGEEDKSSIKDGGQDMFDGGNMVGSNSEFTASLSWRKSLNGDLSYVFRTADALWW